MAIFAELPDGTKLEFPDGTAESVIQRTVKRQLGIAEDPAAPEEAPEPSTFDRVSNAVRDVTKFTPLGSLNAAADELVNGEGDFGDRAMRAARGVAERMPSPFSVATETIKSGINQQLAANVGKSEEGKVKKLRDKAIAADEASGLLAMTTGDVVRGREVRNLADSSGSVFSEKAYEYEPGMASSLNPDKGEFLAKNKQLWLNAEASGRISPEFNSLPKAEQAKIKSTAIEAGLTPEEFDLQNIADKSAKLGDVHRNLLSALTGVEATAMGGLFGVATAADAMGVPGADRVAAGAADAAMYFTAAKEARKSPLAKASMEEFFAAPLGTQLEIAANKIVASADQTVLAVATRGNMGYLAAMSAPESISAMEKAKDAGLSDEKAGQYGLAYLAANTLSERLPFEAAGYLGKWYRGLPLEARTGLAGRIRTLAAGVGIGAAAVGTEGLEEGVAVGLTNQLDNLFLGTNKKWNEGMAEAMYEGAMAAAPFGALGYTEVNAARQLDDDSKKLNDFIQGKPNVLIPGLLQKGGLANYATEDLSLVKARADFINKQRPGAVDIAPVVAELDRRATETLSPGTVKAETPEQLSAATDTAIAAAEAMVDNGKATTTETDIAALTRTSVTGPVNVSWSINDTPFSDTRDYQFRSDGALERTITTPDGTFTEVMDEIGAWSDSSAYPKRFADLTEATRAAQADIAAVMPASVTSGVTPVQNSGVSTSREQDVSMNAPAVDTTVGSVVQADTSTGTIFSASGKPYASQANAAKRIAAEGWGQTHQAVQVEGGWAIAPMQAAAESAPAQPATELEAVRDQQIAAINATLEKSGGTVRMSAQNMTVSDVDTSNSAFATAAQIARDNGQRLLVVDYSEDAPMKPDGWIDGQGNIFVDRNSQDPVGVVVTHEATHALEGTAYYEAVKQAVLENTSWQAKLGFQFAYTEQEQAQGRGTPSQATLSKEFVANIVQNLGADPAFWKEVYAKIDAIKQGEAKGVMDKLVQSFNKAIKKLKALKMTAEQKRIEKIRTAAMEAFARHMAEVKGEAAPAAATTAETSTAPEHANVETGVSEKDLLKLVKEFNSAQKSMMEDGEKITHVFDKPKEGEIVRLEEKVRVYHKDHGWMTVEEAKAKIQEWKDHAAAQAENASGQDGNSQRIVLSLFDKSGVWSQPWEDAGYSVFRFDIQDENMIELYNEETEEYEEINMGDINNFSVGYFNDIFGSFDGNDIYAILAACPCTDFASSGARHFAVKDADGRTISSVQLVHQTLRTIEYFKPAIWAIENPVGRIEKLGGLPPWRLSFDPNHLGDPYTKKTLIWGRFNADLPIAPVDPVEGSKMHSKYGGKSLATKNARSVTPEGFAYGFFMANNAVDHPEMEIKNIYDRLDPKLIEQAVEAGVSRQDIGNAVDDYYYMDLDDKAAEQAIKDLIKERAAGVDEDEVIRDLPQFKQKSPYDVAGDLDIVVPTVQFSVKSVRDHKGTWDERTRLPINKNGRSIVYLLTTPENARDIARAKKLIVPEGATELLFTNDSDAIDRAGGRTAVVQLQVFPDDLEVVKIHDTTEDGRTQVDLRIPLTAGKVFRDKMATGARLWAMLKRPSDPIVTKEAMDEFVRVAKENGITDEALVDSFSWTEARDKIDARITALQKMSPAERAIRIKEVNAKLKVMHNLSDGDLTSQNQKLKKTDEGYELTGQNTVHYQGKQVMSTGLSFAAAQQLGKSVNGCAYRFTCKHTICLSDTSGGNGLYGGIGAFRKATRLSQYLKMEAFAVHPGELAEKLFLEIDKLQKKALAAGKVPAVRLNVNSDIPSKVWEPLIKAFPDVEFYDYSKLDQDAIEPYIPVGDGTLRTNHHITYSFAGASYPAQDGHPEIINAHTNVDQMVRRLEGGFNVAMPFSDRELMPKYVEFQMDEAGNDIRRFKVVNGDHYDFRRADEVAEIRAKQIGPILQKFWVKDGKRTNHNPEAGVIIGLGNKDNASKLKSYDQIRAIVESEGFLTYYNPKIHGDTVRIPYQGAFKEKAKQRFNEVRAGEQSEEGMAAPVKYTPETQFSQKSGTIPLGKQVGEQDGQTNATPGRDYEELLADPRGDKGVWEDAVARVARYGFERNGTLWAFYHAGADGGAVIADKAGREVRSPSSRWGGWLTEDRGYAAKFGTPHPYHAALENPYVTTLDQLAALPDNKYDNLRSDLLAKGHDGIYIKGGSSGAGDQVVIFYPDRAVPQHIFDKSFDDNAIQFSQKLKDLGLERDKQFGVGKNMGGTVYLHRQYEDVLPQEELAYAKDKLEQEQPDFEYNAVRYDRKTGDIAFQESPDFDTRDEPTVGRTFAVKADGSTKLTEPPADPLIWHHKWQWVKDDYEGFDVEAAKQRSIDWKTKLGTDKAVSSRIGRRSFWDQWTAENGVQESVQFGQKSDGLWDLGNITQEFKSDKTSINSSKLPATFSKLDAMGVVQPGDVIADIGGGRFDNAVEWAAEKGATLHVVDPFNRTREHNAKAIAAVRDGQADVVTVNNVLNVIREPENRARVIKQAANALKPGGRAFFLIYEGNGSGVGAPTQQNASWQNNAKTASYLDEIRAEFGDASVKNGMIQAVQFSQKTGLNVRNDGANTYADWIVDGKKTYETRDSDSLRPWVGQTVSIVRTGAGKAKAIGSAKLGEPIVVDEKRFRELQDQHMVPKGSTFDIKPGATKHLYPITEAQRYDKEYDVSNEGNIFKVRDVLFSQKKPFYSQLERALEAQPDRMLTGPGKQVAQWLQSNAPKLGIKKDEIQWTGVTDWLETQKKVTKQDVVDFVKSNGVQVTEVMLSEEAPIDSSDIWDGSIVRINGTRYTVETDEYNYRLIDGYGTAVASERSADALVNTIEDWRSRQGGTKYGQYVLPGGENYKELLLTLPVKKDAAKALPLDWRNVDEQFGEPIFKALVAIASGTGNAYVSKEANGSWSASIPGKSLMTGYTSADEAKAAVEALGVSPVKEANLIDRNKNFRSSHWDTENILAHVRFNERTDADGNRVLFIEEIQSDWGQKGKKEGFGKEANKYATMNFTVEPQNLQETEWKVSWADGTFLGGYGSMRAAQQAAVDAQSRGGRDRIPEAPFVTDTKSWTALAVKRMIAYAVDNSFDKIAFVNGAQSADRYSLSKSISKVEYNAPDGWRAKKFGTVLKAYNNSGDAVINKDVSPEELPDMVGKEVADRLLSSPATDGKHELSGLDLEVGGEGMKAFYDQIVPQVTNDVLKKLGSAERVGDVNLPIKGLDQPVEIVALPYGAKGIVQGRFSNGTIKYLGKNGGWTERVADMKSFSYLDDAYAEAATLRDSTSVSAQPGFTISPDLKAKVESEGLVLFSQKADEELRQKMAAAIAQGNDAVKSYSEQALEAAQSDWEELKRFIVKHEESENMAELLAERLGWSVEEVTKLIDEASKRNVPYATAIGTALVTTRVNIARMLDAKSEGDMFEAMKDTINLMVATRAHVSEVARALSYVGWAERKGGWGQALAGTEKVNTAVREATGKLNPEPTGEEKVLVEKFNHAQRETADAQYKVDEAVESQRQLEEEVAQAEIKMADARKEANEQRAKVRKLEAELRQLDKKTAGYEQKAKDLQTRINQLNAQLKLSEKGMLEAQAKVAGLRQQIKEAKKQIEKNMRRLTTAVKVEQTLDKKLAALSKKARSTLISKSELLMAMGGPEGVRRLFEVMREQGKRSQQNQQLINMFLQGIAKAMVEQKKLDQEGGYRKFVRGLLEQWRAFILTGLFTHFVNLASTAANLALNKLMVESIAAALPGGMGLDKHLKVMWPTLSGLTAVAADIWANMKFAALDETQVGQLEHLLKSTPDQQRMMLEIAGHKWMDNSSKAIRGSVTLLGKDLVNLDTYGKVIRSIGFTPLGMEDAVFKTLSYKYELAKQRAQGKPEDHHAAIMAAKADVFQADLGRLSGGISSFVHQWPELGFLIPFIKTLVNITNRSLQLFPLTGAIIYTANGALGGKLGVDARNRAIGTLLAGAALSAVAILLGGDDDDDKNRLDGMPPAEWRARQQWLETHAPIGFRIGGQHYNMSRFDPLSTVMGLALTSYKTFKALANEDGLSDQELNRVLGGAAQNILWNLFLGKSWMSGTAEFLKDLMGGNLVALAEFPRDILISAAIPNALPQGMDFFEQERYQAYRNRSLLDLEGHVRDAKEAVMYKIPGLRQQLEPRLNNMGEVARSNRYQTLIERTTPANKEINRWLDSIGKYVVSDVKSLDGFDLAVKQELLQERKLMLEDAKLNSDGLTREEQRMEVESALRKWGRLVSDRREMDGLPTKKSQREELIEMQRGAK